MFASCTGLFDKYIGSRVMDHMVRFYKFDLGFASVSLASISDKLHFHNIRLDLLIINAYAEFYKNISFGSRVIVSITN